MDLDVLKNELLRKKRERRRREFLIHFRSLTADSHGLSKMRRHRITVVHEAKKSSFVRILLFTIFARSNSKNSRTQKDYRVSSLLRLASP